MLETMCYYCKILLDFAEHQILKAFPELDSLCRGPSIFIVNNFLTFSVVKGFLTSVFIKFI